MIIHLATALYLICGAHVRIFINQPSAFAYMRPHAFRLVRLPSPWPLALAHHAHSGNYLPSNLSPRAHNTPRVVCTIPLTPNAMRVTPFSGAADKRRATPVAEVGCIWRVVVNVKRERRVEHARVRRCERSEDNLPLDGWRADLW